MKKIAGILLLAIAPATFSVAQDVNPSATTGTEQKKDTKKRPSRDFVMLQLTYENWNNTPDSINVTGFGRGFNGYICYDFPIKQSNFSFAAGLGLSVSNIYFKDQQVVMNSPQDQILFQNVDTGSTDLYKKSKLMTSYLEAPFEIRFFGNKDDRNKGFKAAVGMRVGMLIGTSAKSKNTLPGYTVVEKTNTKRYVQTWRFAPTVRLGWGNFSVYGSYNVSQLFNAGKGPEVFPCAIGICLSGL